MRVLTYSGLDASRAPASYSKTLAALASEDFSAIEVKKLKNLSHGKYYRAKLDYATRLLFCFVRYQAEVCALVLEVIENHDYNKSRFIRGVSPDESQFVDVTPAEVEAEAQSLRYLHPDRAKVQILDKPISWDDAQAAVFAAPLPLILVGSAGSGKTALTLEKLRLVPGEVLYVTQSAYLARFARDLYYANAFAPDEQEATFFSYREFLDSIRVPEGREATWPDFCGWFTRQRQGGAHKGLEAHQVFEEFRGVITAPAQGPLSLEDYLALGVRQSIYDDANRRVVYALFERYRTWLAEHDLFDVNLVAHAWGTKAAARYQCIVIDEVQDLTPVQLTLALKSLNPGGAFLLCGDSNQIVHPNFFSWSAVKSLFWQDPALAQHQPLQVLKTNYRNAQRVTELANTLLKIKHQRFGSIDRESNFLIDNSAEEPGAVALVPANDGMIRDLDKSSRQSNHIAVLVMREEDKAEARKHFGTPLLFAIHEAKGLEYENIVLYGFVSGHRREFNEIVEGVTPEALGGDDLPYSRARDKTDKSLEIYKFFINALYVALTRAVKSLYLVESDTDHPLLRLLGLKLSSQIKVSGHRSSLEEWQQEAHKLELQGKKEQAAAIRNTILQVATPRWPVFEESAVRTLLAKVFRDPSSGEKPRRQLSDYAAVYEEIELDGWLARTRGESVWPFSPEKRNEKFVRDASAAVKRYLGPYSGQNIKAVLAQCAEYGIEHRTMMNQTPLMAAASAGNVALVRALRERGADLEATDHFGANALHCALRHCDFRDSEFAELYELLAPPVLDVRVNNRLVRIDKQQSEYLLFQTLWGLFQIKTHGPTIRLSPRRTHRTYCGRDLEEVSRAVVSKERNRAKAVSAVLARNERSRDYAYNRSLFLRNAHGHYVINPDLQVKRVVQGEEHWVPAFVALNLTFSGQFADPFVFGKINRLLRTANLPACAMPLVADKPGLTLYAYHQYAVPSADAPGVVPALEPESE